MYNVAELIRMPAFLDELAASLDGEAPPPLLRDAKIKLTSRCNLRCVMCKYWQTTTEDALPGERWKQVFAELAGLGCRKVHFSGGEIFLRRDVLDLAEAAVGLGMKVNLTTNGTLIDRERAGASPPSASTACRCRSTAPPRGATTGCAAGRRRSGSPSGPSGGCARRRTGCACGSTSW